MESEKLVKTATSLSLVLCPMCLRAPLADMDKHFAPVSNVESPDAGKPHKQEPIKLPAPSPELSAKFPQPPQRTRHI